MLKGLLLRHLGPVDGDSLKFEAPWASVDWSTVTVVSPVNRVVWMLAVACGGDGSYNNAKNDSR